MVVILLAFGAAGRAVLERPFYWTSGLLLGVALFSAISSIWSGSVELSVTEANRVLVYLGAFLAAFLIAQTEQRRQRFAEGVAIGLIGVAVLGLASRLLPDLISVANGPGSGARLRYPLDYWNANGVAFGIGAGMLLWLSRNALATALRWLAVAALPAMLLALYFTYSRGGLLALAVTAGVLIALSHDRLWILGTLAIGGLGAMPAVLAVQDNRLLADNIASPDTAGQGLTVLAILVAGTLVSLGLFAAMRRLERHQGRLARRALVASRDSRVLTWVAVIAALVAIAAAVAVGGRAWDRFSDSELQVTNTEDRVIDLSGTGRGDFWGVAIEAFGEEPVGGHGAGTYGFSWYQLREIERQSSEAHSLYLESFAELGVVGGLLVLGTVGVILWTGFAAWRAARGRRRELYAVLFAATAAFAIAAAFDWLWEMAGLGVVFFLAAGVLCAGRCAQLARPPESVNGIGGQRRYGLAIAGLALAWISAVALVGPLLVNHELSASRAAANEGDFAKAVAKADSGRSIEPWAASPYLELGLIAEAQGDYATARARLTEAIDREDRNWILYYLRARVELAAGDEAAARADIEAARRLNPIESCLREGLAGCG